MEDPNQTSQAPQTINPVSPTVNSGKSKVVPIILGVAAAIVIAIGAYALGSKQTQPIIQNSVQTTPIPSPTPIDETANWKTYTNTKYDFSINYPNSWEFKDELSKDTGYEAIISFGPKNSQGTVQREIGVLAYKSNLGLDQFIDTMMCHSPGDCASSENAVSINVGNNVGKKVINPPSPISTEFSIVKKDPYILGFQIVTAAPAGKENEVVKRKEILDQILSTFQFTQ